MDLIWARRMQWANLDSAVSGTSCKPLVTRLNCNWSNPTQVTADDTHKLPWCMPHGFDSFCLRPAYEWATAVVWEIWKWIFWSKCHCSSLSCSTGRKKKWDLFSAIVQNVEGTLISCNLPVWFFWNTLDELLNRAIGNVSVRVISNFFHCCLFSLCCCTCRSSTGIFPCFILLFDQHVW